MDRLALFIDDVYPFSYIDHNRVVARAIIINDKREVLLEKITRDDIFGLSTYYETPGGGVNDGESLLDAVKREIIEECGMKIKIHQEIGFVEDDYNLIHRHNLSYYFLAHEEEKCADNKEDYEKDWIREIKYIPLDMAIDMLKNPQNKIAKIVYRRELVILEKVKELLDK